MSAASSSSPAHTVLGRVDRDGIATLTLERPGARNALSRELIEALRNALAEIERDPGVRVVVLAGSGPAFCAGHDLRELQSLSDPDEQRALFEGCSDMMLALTRLPQPVIARVHGVATAAGCQLVASCDLAIAAESARFATPGVNIGLFCTTPMVPLTRAIAPKRALEMLFTGEMIDAAAAASAGLINRAVPDAELDAAVEALARTIASKSRHTLALGKRAYYAQRALPLADAYAYASGVMVENLAAEDAAEGIGAFLEKRPPSWRGR